MVDTVQNMVAPDGLKDLLNPRNSNNLSGFQRAHIIGSAFIRDNIPWFADLIGGADNALNGVLLPEGNRGGLALGVAEHLGIPGAVYLIDSHQTRDQPCFLARLSCIVIPEFPYRVTQCGNRRLRVLFSDDPPAPMISARS